MYTYVCEVLWACLLQGDAGDIISCIIDLLGTRKLIKVGGALVIIKRGAIHGSFRFCFIY